MMGSLVANPIALRDSLLALRLFPYFGECTVVLSTLSPDTLSQTQPQSWGKLREHHGQTLDRGDDY